MRVAVDLLLGPPPGVVEDPHIHHAGAVNDRRLGVDLVRLDVEYRRALAADLDRHAGQFGGDLAVAQITPLGAVSVV